MVAALGALGDLGAAPWYRLIQINIFIEKSHLLYSCLLFRERFRITRTIPIGLKGLFKVFFFIGLSRQA